MIVYPALDLRDGKVVRLRGGDPNQQTIYGDDPAAVADRWIAAGATWLHVVNLDGAFDTANQNESIVRTLAAKSAAIQFGGGLRTLDAIRRAFDSGVKRVVLGTLAVEQPEIVVETLRLFGADALAIGLDARGGQVATRGWGTLADVTPAQLGRQMAAHGIRHALYTDVSRDGELSGVNVAATVELARATKLSVIASGGVSALADVIALRDTHEVAGVILGKALYEGLIDLPSALKVAGE
jgi:phosphoribosylformimino-5-aminoimidazole carboxamide ribotide isomerase